MCIVCGCDTGEGLEDTHADNEKAATSHVASTSANGDLHYGTGTARLSVPGMSQARAIHIEADVLDGNRRYANRNRAHFAAHRVTALNLVSSPGSGKTTLLCASIEALKIHRPGLALAVIEGDQQTSVDAERIRATGAPAIQVAGVTWTRKWWAKLLRTSIFTQMHITAMMPEHCCSSKMSATWSAPRCGTWARPPRSWFSR